MSLWGKIFGTDKAIEKTIDIVSNGFDKLAYTSEEKAEADAKDRSEARMMLLEWIKNTQGQNLARRSIAMAVTFTWLVQFLVAMIIGMVMPWISSADIVGKLTATQVVVNNSAQQMNGAVMLILAFYFAAPHMGDIVSAAMKKFGGK